jgi:sugar phosphate isomerase/epimerase
MLLEIREMGFEYAELSHGIRISLIPGILDAVDKGEIKISSLHNFCPLPLGVNHAAPNIYKFTALDVREREKAYKQTLKTLETAARVKAQLVVLHMGAVDIKDYTDTLIEMVEGRLGQTPKYQKLCHEAIEKREGKKQKHMLYAYEILHAVAERATELGIKLGIENREAVEEIPFEDDFRMFFKQFPQPCIGYWHDTGHGQIKENIGFINHVDHVHAMSPRMHGFHIHDVQWAGRDHVPPGMGIINFAALKPFVKPEHIKVFEMSPRAPAEDVRRGVAHLKSIWGPG